MKSYASVERIEKNFAVCEVEMIGIEKSKPDDFDKTTQIINILIKESVNTKIWFVCGRLKEGDIIVVEHDGENVTKICYKDEAEKKRRIEVLKAIME